MTSYPIEIRRCRHVKTKGTQCGSPALKGKELCYYHEQNRPVAAELYIDGERYSDGSIMLPPFEDAHSIQTVIRHVVQLVLTRRIERKDAGLLLYALQIASGNLKTMQAENAKPTQVVVEPEKAGETPLGMTPWSASGQGHDCDEAEGGDPEAQDSSAPPASPEEVYAAKGIFIPPRAWMTGLRRQSTSKRTVGFVLANSRSISSAKALTRYCSRRAATIWQHARAGSNPNPESLQGADELDLPPGTIQACQARNARMGRRAKSAVR